MSVTPVSVSKLKSASKADASQQVDRLRELMLGPDADRVIKRLVDKDQTTLVADVISEALQQRALRDDSVSQSLSSVVDSAIDASIKDHPDRITNVIFPVMGPAIRKAVAAALQEMVQNLNQVLSEGLSFRSWRWRIQAWRAGKTYAEYVLIKTLQYRVEQVLLIHRETGLLLQDASIPTLEHEDPELVSAMLTAINDFACDAFHKDRQLCVDSIGFGDYTLIIVAGPFALLAGAVRGTPTPEVSTKLSEVVEKIHLDYAPLLVDFDGDRAALEPLQDILRSCLLQKKAGSRRSVPWLAYGALALALCGLSVWGFNYYKDFRQLQQALGALEQQGVLVLDQARSGQSWDLVTLRSEGATDPQFILAQFDLGDLAISIDDRVIPAIVKPEPVAVLSQYQQAITQWETTVNELQNIRLHFLPASAQPVPEDSALLAQLVTKSKYLASLADSARIKDYQLVLTGFADSSGSDGTNLQLSRERAQFVYDHMQANGVVAEKVLLWGMGSLGSAGLENADQRLVSMQVFYDN